MNKRIKEFAEQCSHYPSAPETWFDYEKFTAMIVRECLETIEEMDPHSTKRDIDDIYSVVEKHFGIKK